MQSDLDSSTAICSDLLSAYQGTVVHDLRGDLNGLLLTLDYLRRQLLARPETASLFGESLGDLDNVRGALIRTLNQLEVVGQARRVVAGRSPPAPTDQNLPEVVAGVVASLGERIKRRGVSVTVLPASDLLVRADPVLLQLAIHRIVGAVADLARNTEIRLGVERPDLGIARFCLLVVDAKMLPPDLISRSITLTDTTPPIPGAVLSLGLVSRLANQLGGKLQGEFMDDGGFQLCFDLPAGSEDGRSDGR